MGLTGFLIRVKPMAARLPKGAILKLTVAVMGMGPVTATIYLISTSPSPPAQWIFNLMGTLERISIIGFSSADSRA